MLKTFRLLVILFGMFAVTGCSNLIQKPESQWTVEEFYDRAKSEFDNGQWKSAIEFYEKLKANFPYGDYAEQAYLELAYAYYRYDEPLSAIRELDEFIRLYPRHQQLAYAYFLKALAADSINRSWLDRIVTDPANRDIQSTQQALRAYQEIIQRFPNTDYAIAAKQRIVIITNRLARRDLQVAQFYYERQAYLAAASRAQRIIEEYPNSQSSRDALVMLRKAHQKMGLDQTAADIQQVIELNR